MRVWLLMVAGLVGCATPQTGGPPQTGPVVPAQVAYDLAISQDGTRLEDAGNRTALLGKVTIACLDDGNTMVIGRDAQNRNIYQKVLSSAPASDIASGSYTHIFSEILRVAWTTCHPAQSPLSPGEGRKVETIGAFAVSGYVFPDEVKIADRVGVRPCAQYPVDERSVSYSDPDRPCHDPTPPQPYIATLNRKR